MSASTAANRVLVIDDDEAIAASLEVVLRAKGYDVVTARDGASGLAQYRAHHPQIVISDIMMPDQLGIDTIDRIRRSSPAVLIIAMSGSIMARGEDFVGEACAAGADVCLHKPFELTELLKAMAHVPQGRPAPVRSPGIGARGV